MSEPNILVTFKFPQSRIDLLRSDLNSGIADCKAFSVSARDLEYEMLEEIERLQAIVDKLPETKDDVHVLPGDTVWSIGDDGVIEERGVLWSPQALWSSEAHPWPGYSAGFGIKGPPIAVEDCYSTREAAEAAREK